MFRIDGERLFVVALRFFEVPESTIRIAEIIQDIGVGTERGQQKTKRLDRLFEPFRMDQRNGREIARLWLPNRIEEKSMLIRFHRITRETVESVERVPEFGCGLEQVRGTSILAGRFHLIERRQLRSSQVASIENQV